MIGPKENTSFVDESYDIPRSLQQPYFKITQNMVQDQDGIFPLNGSIVSSTPNLVQENGEMRPDSRHCYTNAAPTKIEGNVFRYDFFEDSTPAPMVNRKLKPKLSTEKIQSNGYGMIRVLPAPTVDRKLKPTIGPKVISINAVCGFLFKILKIFSHKLGRVPCVERFLLLCLCRKLTICSI